MREIRTLHAHPSGACPWTIYVYVRNNELRIWPEERIRIHPGEGVMWAPIEIAGGGTVGVFTIELPEDSPFESSSTSGDRVYAGPVTTGSGTFTYRVKCEYGTVSMEIEVEPIPDDCRIASKKISVRDNGHGKTAVSPTSLAIFSKHDELEWLTDDTPGWITVEFKNDCPFNWPNKQKKAQGSLRSGKAKSGHKRYAYTITLDNLAPLDPDVEVDPPGGGGDH